MACLSEGILTLQGNKWWWELLLFLVSQIIRLIIKSQLFQPPSGSSCGTISGFSKWTKISKFFTLKCTSFSNVINVIIKNLEFTECHEHPDSLLIVWTLCYNRIEKVLDYMKQILYRIIHFQRVFTGRC